MLVVAVITAAGKSERFGATKKEYMRLEDSTVLACALAPFMTFGEITRIVITLPPGEAEQAQRCLSKDQQLAFDEKRVCFVDGGLSRRASVLNALESLKSMTPDFVLVHDGARPFCTVELITRVLAASVQHGAAVPLVPTVDTGKEIDGTGKVIRHLPRAFVKAAQTPQGFRFHELYMAHVCADADKDDYTDDSEIYADFSGIVWSVEGDPANRKITFREDLP
jgi:2-C-methyl-D-erythritol 4-phosphate cytidylyltransferase